LFAETCWPMACSSGSFPADAAVKKKRVVGFARRLRDGERGGVGEVVVVADDERIKVFLGLKCGSLPAARSWTAAGVFDFADAGTGAVTGAVSRR